jgi:hypothetical protein
MFLLFEVVASFIGGVIFEGVVRGLSSRATRRRFRNDTVQCDLRSAEGRIYNMGTEWSSGLATVTHGHISFDPSLGIVGKREIDVDLIETARLADSRTDPFKPNSTILQLVTRKGCLEWSLDTDQLKRAAELLSGIPASG